MKRWKALFTSSVFRIILLVLAVVIPLNILTLVLARQVLTEAEDQARQESEFDLKFSLSLIDDEVRRINRITALMAIDDADFLRLAGREVTDLAERYRQTESLSSLMATLSDRLDENQAVAGFFAYFPRKGQFAIASNRGARATMVRDEIMRLVNEADSLECYKQGALLEVSGRPILLVMGTRRGALCGGWIDLAETSAWPSFSRENRLALTDRAGHIHFLGEDFPATDGTQLSPESLKSRDILYVSAEAERADISLTEAIERRTLFDTMPAARRALLLLAVASLLLIPLSILLLQRQVIAPLQLLTEAMRQVDAGHVDYRIETQHRFGSEFDQLNENFNRTMDELRELRISLYEQELKAATIKMAFLAQQIRPHFVLNALNILYSYEKDEYELGQRLILCLSRYFRYVVNAETDFVELGQELEHIRNYFEIQRARFPSTFRAEVSCPEELADCRIPPLLIQNLAENAIKHAFTPGETTLITVTAETLPGARARVTIADTGVGISDEVLARIEEFRKTREFRMDLGVGIQNSIDRLSLLYGERADLRIRRGETRGTVIEVEIPIERGEEET